MDDYRKTKITGQVAANLPPGVATVVAAHHVPVLLHEQHIASGWVPSDPVHAVADLGIRIGDALRAQAAVGRAPGLSGIVTAKNPCGGDGDVQTIGVRWVEENGVYAHPAGARLPARSAAMAAQAGELLPLSLIHI